MPLNDIMGGGQLDAFTAGQTEQQANLASLLKNQTTTAQLPGVVGTAQKLGAEGQIAQAGVPGQISEQASKIQTQLSTDELTRLTNAGGLLSGTAAKIGMMPPVARAAAVQGLAKNLGVDPDHPLVKGIIGDPADPDGIPKRMQQVGQGMQAASQQAYQQSQSVMGRERVATIGAEAKKAVQESKNESAAKVQEMRGATAENVANIAAKTKQWLLENKAVSLDQLVAQRTKEYQTALESGEDSSDALQKLHQANEIYTAAKQNPVLQAQFQAAGITEKVLGKELAPNTTTPPIMNPTANFPTQKPGSATPSPNVGPAPVATRPAPTSAGNLPPGIPPGSIATTQYTDDGTHRRLYKAPNGKLYAP